MNNQFVSKMNKETLNKLKKCSKEFCDETSTHGLANIVKTDIQVIRIIWILLVLTAAIYCSYCKHFTELKLKLY